MVRKITYISSTLRALARLGIGWSWLAPPFGRPFGRFGRFAIQDLCLDFLVGLHLGRLHWQGLEFLFGFFVSLCSLDSLGCCVLLFGVFFGLCVWRLGSAWIACGVIIRVMTEGKLDPRGHRVRG